MLPQRSAPRSAEGELLRKLEVQDAQLGAAAALEVVDPGFNGQTAAAMLFEILFYGCQTKGNGAHGDGSVGERGL